MDMESQESIDKRSRPNCVLYILTPLVIVLLVVGALTAGYFAFDKNISFFTTVSNETWEEESNFTCSNANCVQAASQILKFVDESVDPCTDYHQFVCGTFLKTAYENDIKNPFLHDHLKLLKQRDHLIIEPINPDDSHLVQIQKQFYQSCLNEDRIEDSNLTVSNITNTIEEFFEDQWNTENFDWMDTMIVAKKLGLPFDWFLRVDLHEANHYNLLITYPKDCSSFHSNITMTREMLEALSSETEETAEIQNIISFQKKLLLICEKSKNEEATEGYVSDLENLWFREGCLHFITSITGQNKKWRLDSKIVYHNYIVRLSHLLKSTPKKTQSDFVMWKIIEYFAPFLKSPLRDIYLDSKNFANRFEFCLEDTKQRFRDVSTGVQIQKFLQTNREEKEEFVTALIDEAKNQIDQITWNEEAQKEKNLMFYRSLRGVIGGLADMGNAKFFDSYFNLDQVHFKSDNTIAMIQEINKGTFGSKMEKIGQPLFRKNLVEMILKSNNLNQILIQSEESAIVVPSLLFDGMLYNENVPNCLNFGGLGTLIALPLSQHFLQVNTPLNEAYQQAIDNQYCFLDNLERSKITIDPSAVFATNHPFLIAQDLAYKAYQKNIDKYQDLVGLRYTPNQLFWIKSTLNWCLAPEDGNDEDYELYKLRILESVRNSEQFTKDFNCNYGSAMNPVKKCAVL